MKASFISAVVAPAVLANAQWWGGAPDCAHDCFSSVWSSSSLWPAPTEYCGGNDQGFAASSCVSSACSATPTATESYSSLSSSLCSQWSSCSSAGSTGTYTLTAPGFTGGAGAGPRFGGGSRTWTGGTYTVTGCEWDGSPWAGGPGGMGYGGGLNHGPGGSPWGDWGHGWTWTTRTASITRTLTTDQSTTTSTGLATIAEAAQSGVTSTTILNRAEETNAAAPMAKDNAVKMVGAVLGGMVAVAGIL